MVDIPLGREPRLDIMQLHGAEALSPFDAYLAFLPRGRVTPRYGAFLGRSKIWPVQTSFLTRGT